MVGEHHHDGALEASLALEGLEQAAEVGVEEGDLAVVQPLQMADRPRVVLDRGGLLVEHRGDGVGVPAHGPLPGHLAAGEAGAELLRRPIGVVGVEVVQVGEEGLLQAADRGERHVRHAARVPPLAVLVEGGEPAAEAAVWVVMAGCRPHDRARRHGGGLPAPLGQHLGERRDPLGDAERAAGLGQEVRGVPRGEQRVDRGEGARGLGSGALEEVAARGQGVEVGGRRARVAVGAHVVGPQGVEHHDQDVERLRLPAAGEHGGAEEGPDEPRGERSQAHRRTLNGPGAARGDRPREGGPR